jgi:hypothetical protein
MAKVLIAGAQVQCSHKGTLQLPLGDNRFTIGGAAAILFGKEANLSLAPGAPGVLAPCPFIDPSSGSPSPCATLPATAGQSQKITVGGVPVLLDSATGPTLNASPAAAGLTWSVAFAGQSEVDSS